MARGSVVGPATGGVLLYPLYNKRATQAGARVEDFVQMPVAARVVSAAGHSTGTAGSNFVTQAGGTTISATKASGSVGTYATSNEGAGHSLLSPATTGVAWLATAAAAAARVVPRGGSIGMECTGAGPAAFALSDHVMVAVQGHRYDPDDAAAPNIDPPYFSSKD